MEITNNTILQLIVRQGSDLDRKNVILTSGELGYTNDLHRLFVGDGALLGGNVVGNIFLGIHSPVTLATPGVIGDVAFDSDLNNLYILKQNDGSTITDWQLVNPIPPLNFLSLSGGVITGSLSSNGSAVFYSVNANTSTFDTISAGNYQGITKTMVGLPLVDNTTDVNKPISTLTQNALNLKVNTTTFNASSANYAVKNANNHFTTTQTISGDLIATGKLNVGWHNVTSGDYSSVAGGCSNIVGGNYSSILGGYSNCICATATCSSILAGTGITALSADTSYTPSLILTNVPTASAVGMTSGTIWRCTTTNVLYIMP